VLEFGEVHRGRHQWQLRQVGNWIIQTLKPKTDEKRLEKKKGPQNNGSKKLCSVTNSLFGEYIYILD